jgi:oxygen-independent coproporphyrinogen-3 oxidase
MTASRLSDPGFGLYVHWPFCLAKCPYCDFNSHVSAGIDQQRWQAALLTGLRRISADMEKRRLASIFFGGGTPSLMAPQTVGALLDEIAALYPLADDLEVTLEANPTSVEAERFLGFRAAGVNRVSIGVQALDDAVLRFLGRRHTAGEALSAIALAARSFPRLSFDLIYARPGQTEAAWRAELARALALGPEHLSLYQLTYEEGTPFGAAHARGTLPALDEDSAAALYDLTQALCEEAGLPAYEISNHARAGAECRHNLVYWRYGDYIGLGPGAHGRLGGAATTAFRAPAAWLAAIEAGGDGTESTAPLSRAEQASEYASMAASHAAGGDGTESTAPLSRAEQASEYLLMSLRLAEGTQPARYEALGGVPLAEARIAALVEDGLLLRDPTRIRATPLGRLVLNSVIAALAA